MPPVHADEPDGAVAGDACRMAERLLQEGGESGRGHLARSHGELAVADPAKPADMAVNGKVVGRVGEHQVRMVALHQHGEALTVAGIAAQQLVAAEEP